jgi:hypothetical protein
MKSTASPRNASVNHVGGILSGTATETNFNMSISCWLKRAFGSKSQTAECVAMAGDKCLLGQEVDADPEASIR